MTNDLSVEMVQERLTTRYVGREMIHLAETHSTQNVAAEHGRAGAPEGLIVTADQQTAGRGRFRRAWVSPPGGSLLVSALLRPPPQALPMVFMAVALAVPQAIRAVVPELAPEVKWPNDILLSGRKVCGVLVETTYGDDGAPQFTVAGLGLNVNWDTASVPEIADTATSLSRETGRSISRAPLLSALLNAFEDVYEESKAGAGVFTRWRDSLITIGRTVRVSGSDAVIEGVAEDVEPSGALVVRDGTGARHVVHAGDVTLS